MKVLADTNILGRLADLTDPQNALAQQAVSTLVLAGYELCIVPQNIYEFWVVATRPKDRNGLGLSFAEAATKVAGFKAFFTMHGDVPEVFAEWERTITKHSVVGKGAHDARFVATVLVHDIDCLLTFNLQDFRRYSEIKLLTERSPSN